MASIPVIDLHDFPNQSSKLMAACEEWGCMRLLNFHEILPTTLMAEMNTVVRSLFDLPVEIKRRNVGSIIGSGYVGNPLQEALELYDMASPPHLDTFCSQLQVSPHQREIIGRYVEAIQELFVRIGEKLAEGLGVKSENIGFENWLFQIRLNKYHFTPETIGSSGLPIHTDSGLLTILQDDEVGGLEVMNKSGELIAVDPWPGTHIVIMGDMANVWSNGRFCNLKHRVQCKEGKIRVSIASQILGPKEALEVPPELVDDDHPCMYMPTIYEDYRKLRLSKNMFAGETIALLCTPTSNGKQ